MRFVGYLICCVCIFWSGYRYLGGGDTDRRESLHVKLRPGTFSPFRCDIFVGHRGQERDSSEPFLASQTPIIAISPQISRKR